jgi:hypothetical protein
MGSSMIDYQALYEREAAELKALQLVHYSLRDRAAINYQSECTKKALDVWNAWKSWQAAKAGSNDILTAQRKRKFEAARDMYREACNAD